MIFPNHRFSFSETISSLGDYQEIVEDEMRAARNSLEWAREASCPHLRAFHLNFAFLHGRKAIHRHTHQRELLRMAFQKDAYCSAKIGTMVYTTAKDELKAHGVVVDITPTHVRVFITHSNLTFFGGMIDIPRKVFWDHWDSKD